MTEFYQRLDAAGGFDYALHQIPEIGNQCFRGPPVELSGRFMACVGAAQTFGRFAERPFPALLSQRFQIPVANLGVGGAGPIWFSRPERLQLINRAELVVIQVLSGRSASNSVFDNSISGGVLGRYRDSQAPVRADAAFAELAHRPQEVLARIVRETREDYLRSFIGLLKDIVVPKILFWFSVRSPRYKENYAAFPQGVFGAFPQLVTDAMVEEIRPHADAYVECVSAAGLPQALWRSDKSIDGAVLRDGVLTNLYYPTPAMHLRASEALAPTCASFLGAPTVEGRKEPARTFVIIGAARTGTNLLVGLLQSHDDCYIGGELFNAENIAKDLVPWQPLPEEERVDLLKMRGAAPVQFLQRLQALATKAGHTSVGFKLLYSQANAQRAVLEHVVADKSVRVIHLTRRNLLRRFVSEKQAQATGKWAVSINEASNEVRPKVHLDPSELVSNLRSIGRYQEQFAALFSSHRVLNIIYEDLAARPRVIAERAARFLELVQPASPGKILFQRTGSLRLADAAEGHEAFRRELKRWLAYFDE